METLLLPVEIRVKGAPLVVRRATAADVDGLTEFYRGLSDDDRHRRFFTAQVPSRAAVARWLEVTADRGDSLVVETMDPPRIVGEAGWVDIGDARAELAIALDAGWRGWLAPYLVDLAVRSAAERGMEVVEADVLSSNCAMSATLRARGAAVIPQADPGTVRLVVGTTGPTPVWSSTSAHPRVLVERAPSHWSGAVAAAEGGLAVFVCPDPVKGRAHPCPLLAGDHCPLVDAADAVVVVMPRSGEDPDAVIEAHRSSGTRAPVLVVDASIGRDGFLQRLARVVADGGSRPEPSPGREPDREPCPDPDLDPDPAEG